MTNTKFPIIADDEIMLTEMPHMNLYDELDLISNIKGDYQDRNYLEWMPIAKLERSKLQLRTLKSRLIRKIQLFAMLSKHERKLGLI